MEPTLKHKIGQMLLAGFPSTAVDEQARRLIAEYEVGNFILFARNFQSACQTVELTAELSKLVYEKTGLAPFIGADQEGGIVCRVTEGAAMFSGAMAIAANGSEEDAYAVGKNCGEILRAMGVNTNFAPVLDVNIEPLNPVIGTRSFGDVPAEVSRYGNAMLHGMQAGGLLCTVKHYPGHGNVKTDSHLALPVNDTDPALLEKTEFLPFQGAFDAGAEALMSCHVRFDKIDPDHPATLSKAILTGLLRERQGFDGLVVTDCMEMDAIRATVGTAEGAVQAVEAGCDILTISHSFDAVAAAAQALYAAVESGRISEKRIEASYRRILAAKKRRGLTVLPEITVEKAQATLFDTEKIALHKRVAQGSVTLVSDSGGVAAFAAAKKPAFFAPVSYALSRVEDGEKVPNSFCAAAAERFGGTAVELPLDRMDEGVEQAIAAADYDVAVVGLYNARFREGQLNALRRLEASGKPLVVVALGGPYDASYVRRADAVIAAYEYTPLSLNAVLDALAEGKFTGKMPTKL